MRLYIAEKPSLAEAIAHGIGNAKKLDGYYQCANDTAVTWCYGHMLVQQPPEGYDPELKMWSFKTLPIVPKEWKLLPNEKTAPHLKKIGNLISQANEIVNAGDPDREGQLIVDELLNYFGNRSPVQRIWLAAVDAGAVKKALAGLRDNAEYQPLMRSALARSRADWLIGLNLTRAFTLLKRTPGTKEIYSVGRVQTPTLALVVARDREIEAFTPTSYFTLSADIEHSSGRFAAKWKPQEHQPGLDVEKRLTDAKAADAIVTKCKGRAGTIAECETKASVSKPPLLFSGSDIQAKASAKFGYSVSAVLDACQSLYETHKLASYPRTGNHYLPETQFDDRNGVLDAIRANSGDYAPLVDAADRTQRSEVWNTAKVEAHHGLAPTAQTADLSKLSPIERNVYDMIVRSYLAQFYPDHLYDQTSVRVDVAGESFTASGRVVTAPGWKTIYSFDADDEDPKDAGDEATLPPMAAGDAATATDVKRAAKNTKPPRRFTEASLLKAMTHIAEFITNPEHKKRLRETDGIGTEATRGNIIELLQTREFLSAEKKNLISTSNARSLIDALPDAVKDPGMTAIYEATLSDIEAGKADSSAFISTQIAFVTSHVAEAKTHYVPRTAPEPECPVCFKEHGGTLRRIKKKDSEDHFWGCKRYTEGCRGSAKDKDGKPDFTKTAATTLAPAVSDIPCPSCGTSHSGRLRRIKGPKGHFWGCTRYREGCKTSLQDKAGKPFQAAR